MPITLEQFRGLSASVRRKPGMYFGGGGREAIPRMIEYAVTSILEHGADAWRGKLEVSVGNDTLQRITIRFDGLLYAGFLPNEQADWLGVITGRASGNWWLEIIAGASVEFVIESSDGVKCRKMVIRDGEEIGDSVGEGDGTVYLGITFSPASDPFKTAGVDEYYKIIGWLGDLSMLRAGMRTRFMADDLEGEASSYYRDGMKSHMMEADYARYSQHPGCLHFAAVEKDMVVEGYLRFVHAGVPSVKNFVNYYPTQGGSHLEGLAKALRELFPDDTRGCRQSRFITNPDINAGVVIPRPFIGVMHLQLKEPRYYAPTRDVLKTEGVADFVYRAAAETLKKQWAILNPPIDYEAIYRKIMASKTKPSTDAATGDAPVSG